MEYILNDKYIAKTKKAIKQIKYILGGLNNTCFICISHSKSKNTGYYKIKRDGILYDMHNYIYQIYNGNINKGLVVRHKCNNKFCINPEHLILGTQKDNCLDRIKDNPKSNRLNKDIVIEIKNLISIGLKNSEIAEKFKLNVEHISKIRNGLLWKNV